VTLFLERDDVLELWELDDAPSVASAIARRATHLPEMTRGLKLLGSSRGAPGAAHDAWFAPWLSARRSAESAGDVTAQLTAFDATRMRTAMTHTFAELAAITAPTDDRAQRAIEARLEDAAREYLAVLDTMEQAALRVRAAGADTRLRTWRARGAHCPHVSHPGARAARRDTITRRTR
jgi:hypothetical protein